MKETKAWLINQKDLRLVALLETMKEDDTNLFDAWIHLGHVVFKEMDLQGIEKFENALKTKKDVKK